MKRLLLLILCALGLVFTVAVKQAAAVTTTPSSTTWTCAGGETDFTPSFSFVTYQHVVVKIDTVTQVLGTDYTWFDADTIRLTTPCSAAEVLSMVRDSDPSNPVVTFTSGSRLSAAALNDALLQNIYAMEELEENTTVQGMAKSGGHWDAANLRIQNCSDAIGDTDVACWGQLTIANADLYPGTATDNKLVKGNGTAYVEAETLADASVGDAEKLVTVNAGGTGLEYDTFANYMAAWAPISAADTDVTWTGTTPGPAPAGFIASITLPDTGIWSYQVTGMAVCLGTANADSDMSVNLQRQIDGGGWVTLDTGYVRDDEDGTSSAWNMEVSFLVQMEDQSGANLDFRLNLSSITNCSLAPTSTNPHRIGVLAWREKD